MTEQDEKTWAMLSHLGSLLSYVTGLGGPVAALIIWAVYKDRSTYVGQQALQSLIFQIVGLVLVVISWIVTGVLSAFIIGICLIPIALVLSAVVVIWPLYAAYECSQGKNFRYPIIADMVGIA